MAGLFVARSFSAWSTNAHNSRSTWLQISTMKRNLKYQEQIDQGEEHPRALR